MNNLKEFKEWHKNNPTIGKKYFYEYSEESRQWLVNQIPNLNHYFEEKFGYHLYLIFGALLGVIRNNDLIMWDDDIDLAYLSKYHTKEEIKEEFGQICEILKQDGMWMNNWNGLIHCNAPNTTATYDIFVSWIIENNFYIYSTKNIISADIIIPLKKHIFKGNQVWIPNKPETFLEGHYVNWREPIIPTNRKSITFKTKFKNYLK